MGELESFKILYLPRNVNIGFHIPKTRSLENSFKSILSTEPQLRSFQIFLGNPRRYGMEEHDIDDIIRCRELLLRADKYSCVHSSLCINLCGSTSSDDDEDFDNKLNNSIRRLSEELDIAAGFGAVVVVHTGTCKDRAKGMSTIISTINKVLDIETMYTRRLSQRLGIDIRSRRKLALENCAGERNKIGDTLQDMDTIISSVHSPSQVKMCIDTQHLFGAGRYDLGMSRDVDKFYDEMNELKLNDKLELFHFNDSKVEYSSHKDRHDEIGKGYIFNNLSRKDSKGIEGLTRFLDYAKQSYVPLIGEPPTGGYNYDFVNSVVQLHNVCTCTPCT